MRETEEKYRCTNCGAIMSGVRGKCPNCGSFLWLDTRAKDKEPSIGEKIFGVVIGVFVVVLVGVFIVSGIYKIFGPEPPPQDPHWTKMPDISKIGPDKIDVLFKALKRYGEGSRCNAAYYLGKMKDPRAVKPLITALKKDESVRVRESAAFALGEFNDSRAVNALINAVDDTSMIKTKVSTMPVRYAAVKALGKIDDPRAYEAVKAALRNPNISIRTEAIQAIGQYGARESNRDDQREILIGFLQDKDSHVRKAAAQALGGMADSLAIARKDSFGR